MPYLYYVHHIDADGHGFDLFVSADTPTAARDFWRGYYADAAMREPTRIDLVPVGAASGPVPWEKVVTVWPIRADFQRCTLEHDGGRVICSSCHDIVPDGEPGTAHQGCDFAEVEIAPTEADYETAAEAEGWTGPHTDKHGVTYYENETEPYRTGTDKPGTWTCQTWQQLCAAFDIEPEPKP